VGHVGICVRDLARALRFWRDGLGFRPLTRVRVADEDSARLLRLPRVDQETVFLERDGVRLALFAFRDPPPLPPPEAPRAMNEPGLAAVMLRVDDLEATAERLVEAGGHLLEETRVDHPAWGSRLVFLTDPDGTLVELVEIPGDPYAPFGDPA